MGIAVQEQQAKVKMLVKTRMSQAQGLLKTFQVIFELTMCTNMCVYYLCIATQLSVPHHSFVTYWSCARTCTGHDGDPQGAYHSIQRFDEQRNIAKSNSVVC